MEISEINTGYGEATSVIRINQKVILNERCPQNFDFNDAAIFSFCAEFILSERSESHPQYPHYKWISRTLILRALPLLRIKKEALSKRLKKIVKAGLLRSKINRLQNPNNGKFDTMKYYKVTKKGHRIFLNIKSDYIPEFPWFDKIIYSNLENINIAQKIHNRTHSILLDAYKCKGKERKSCPFRFNEKGWSSQINTAETDMDYYCYLPQRGENPLNPACIAWNCDSHEIDN